MEKKLFSREEEYILLALNILKILTFKTLAFKALLRFQLSKVLKKNHLNVQEPSTKILKNFYKSCPESHNLEDSESSKGN